MDGNKSFAGDAVLSAERLARIPRELLEKLCDATIRSQKKGLNGLISRVRETEDSEAANALQQLADKHEYDTLTRVLEEACHQ